MLAGTGSLNRLEIENLLTTGYVIPAIVLDPVATFQPTPGHFRIRSVGEAFDRPCIILDIEGFYG
jgi:hypothetical protein